MKEQKKYFISFADSRMSAATQRIAKQAEAMNIFDEIHVLDESSLEPEFCEKWKHVMKFGVRGFGYWCWKPYVILRLMEKIPDGSFLLYCDSGCHLNPKGIARLHDYINETNASADGVKAFCTFFRLIDITEQRWTKGDIFDYYNCRNNKEITDTPQIATTQILLRKCDSSMQFLREWNQVWYDNFPLIDDSPSKSKNLPGFIENRHDQSIFSVMYKLRGYTPLPSGETDVADYSNMEKYPIWDVRDRGFKDKRFFPRVKRLLRAYVIKSKIVIEKLKMRFSKENK